jgi:hypothetical protein
VVFKELTARLEALKAKLDAAIKADLARFNQTLEQHKLEKIQAPGTF